MKGKEAVEISVSVPRTRAHAGLKTFKMDVHLVFRSSSPSLIAHLLLPPNSNPAAPLNGNVRPLQGRSCSSFFFGTFTNARTLWKSSEWEFVTRRRRVRIGYIKHLHMYNIALLSPQRDAMDEMDGMGGKMDL